MTVIVGLLHTKLFGPSSRTPLSSSWVSISAGTKVCGEDSCISLGRTDGKGELLHQCLRSNNTCNVLNFTPLKVYSQFAPEQQRKSTHHDECSDGTVICTLEIASYNNYTIKAQFNAPWEWPLQSHSLHYIISLVDDINGRLPL